MPKLDCSSIEPRRKKAVHFFKGRYPREDADDFSSFCVEQWLTGRSILTNFSWMATDYFRIFGTKFKTGRGSLDLMQQPHRSDTSLPGLELERYPTASNPIEEFHIADLLRHKRLNSFDRSILILSYQWDFSQEEIGDLFGVSPSRICQFKKEAETILKTIVNEEENMNKPTRCDACQMVKPLDRAHIKSKKSGGSMKEHNILFLCRGCHSLSHMIGWRLFLIKHPKLVEYMKFLGWSIDIIHGRFLLTHEKEHK